MKTNARRYRGYRFPPEIISHSVWLYHRFSLSFRDVEDLLAKRGVVVSYETIRQWCRKSRPEYARRLKHRQARFSICRGRRARTFSFDRELGSERERSPLRAGSARFGPRIVAG